MKDIVIKNTVRVPQFKVQYWNGKIKVIVLDDCGNDHDSKTLDRAAAIKFREAMAAAIVALDKDR